MVEEKKDIAGSHEAWRLAVIADDLISYNNDPEGLTAEECAAFFNEAQCAALADLPTKPIVGEVRQKMLDAGIPQGVVDGLAGPDGTRALTARAKHFAERMEALSRSTAYDNHEARQMNWERHATLEALRDMGVYGAEVLYTALGPYGDRNGFIAGLDYSSAGAAAFIKHTLRQRGEMGYRQSNGWRTYVGHDSDTRKSVIEALARRGIRDYEYEFPEDDYIYITELGGESVASLIGAVLQDHQELPDVRAAAAMALGRINTPESRQFLIAELSTDDPDIAKIACATALGRDDSSPDVLAALLISLESPDALLRIAAANALGDLRFYSPRGSSPPVTAIPALEKMARKAKPSSEDREWHAAVHAMGKIGTKDGARALVKILRAEGLGDDDVACIAHYLQEVGRDALPILELTLADHQVSGRTRKRLTEAVQLIRTRSVASSR